MTKELRCIHRHTIRDHPKCFQKGLVKYKDSREFERKTHLPWFQMPGTRIGYFDIETDNLTADFGTMLSWCIKEKGGVIYYDTITKDDLFSGVLDRRIVENLVNTLKGFDIIITYFGTKFDLPFARAKALHYNIDFPEYGDIFHFDIYYTVKSTLKLSRNSLDNACDYLGIKGKTPISKDVWRMAKYGDPNALKEVLIHNEGDVVILEQLHDKLEFSKKWIRRSI